MVEGTVFLGQGNGPSPEGESQVSAPLPAATWPRSHGNGGVGEMGGAGFVTGERLQGVKGEGDGTGLQTGFESGHRRDTAGVGHGHRLCVGGDGGPGLGECGGRRGDD